MTDQDKLDQNSDVFRAAIAELSRRPDHDAERREHLLEFQRLWGAGARVISYMANPGSPFSSLSSEDVAPIASALQRQKPTQQLLLVLNSGGGDAYAAQKIIDVCRAHCRRFFVVVPDRAKSAATIVALGSDQIVMGYVSELGPIDPQIAVIVSGVPHYVSANSFIQARDALRDTITEKQGRNEPVLAYLQELSGLDMAFVRECERMTEWSMELAIEYLSKHMLARPGVTKAKARDRAGKIAKDLSTRHLQHGELIGPAACKRLGLDIFTLRRNDRRWRALWRYYVRVAIQFSRPRDAGSHVTKLFETPDATLTAQAQNPS